jgi:hypothetical protein
MKGILMKNYYVCLFLLITVSLIIINCTPENGFPTVEPTIAPTIGPTPTPLYCSCLDILTHGESTGSGVYEIDPDSQDGNPEFQVYCDMDFDIGGWTAVFNYIPTQSNADAAAAFHAAITTNAEMTGPVMPDSTSTAIYTSNLPLSEYNEVVYGWASSPANSVTRYGTYSNTVGLAGESYLDGYYGAGVEIADFTVYPANIVQTIDTGNDPSYPHVGMGFDGQIIVWGYDNNASAFGHWGNWYMSNPCCNAGNTEDVVNLGWRYVIYIR